MPQLKGAFVLFAALLACLARPTQSLPRGRSPGRALSEKERSRVEELAAQASSTPGLSASLKPGFHVAPPQGWMNDPNGPLEFPAGQLYHLFYQYNPSSPKWAAPSWGHVASADLVHWMQLPSVALQPAAYYDSDGVFSGSATLLTNGTPAIMYTGVSRFEDLGYYYQVQALATPTNTSDPLLQHWLKRSDPVMPLAPPGGNHAQWRDPTTATWVEAEGGGTGAGAADGSYFLSVGAQQHCQGGAALYEAGPAFDSWSYRGVLFSIGALTNGSSSSACPQPDGELPAGGQQEGEDLATCPASSQFGDCAVWECPDWFPLRGTDISVFKYSDQVSGRRPFGQDWYVLSDQPVGFASRAGQPPPQASPTSPSAALFSNTMGGAAYGARLLDHGEIYASKTFRTSDGRAVWWGWTYESSLGCTEMCGDGTSFTAAMGWQGAQTLPREITYDPATTSLLLNPVKEAEGLRQSQLFSGVLAFYGSITDSMVVGSSIVLPASAPLRQLELLAAFNLSGAAPTSEGQQRFRYTVGATVQMGRGSQLAVTLNGTAVDDSADGPRITQAGMWVDTSGVGGATQGGVWGGLIALPAGGMLATDLRLRLLVDHSVVEAFGLGGRMRATARVYPLDPAASWGVSLFARLPGGAAVADTSVWRLGSCWVEQLDLRPAPPPA